MNVSLVERHEGLIPQRQPEALEAAQHSLGTLLDISRGNKDLGEGESFTGLMTAIVTAMPDEERSRPVKTVVAKRLSSVLGEPDSRQQPLRGRSMLAMAVIADRIRSVSRSSDAVVGRLVAMNYLAHMAPAEAASLLVGEGTSTETVRAQVAVTLKQVWKKGWNEVAPRVHALLYDPDVAPKQFLALQTEIAAATPKAQHRDQYLGKSAVGAANVKKPLTPAGEYFEEEELTPVKAELSDDPLTDYMNMAGKTKLLNQATEIELAKRIEAGVAAAHVLECEDELVAMAEHDLYMSGAFADEIPLEERERLLTALRGDLQVVIREGERARERFARANLLLVIAIAARKVRRDVSMLELVQYGNIGLMRAIDLFDYKKGYKFSTYATWWIRKEIDSGIYKQAQSTHIPRDTFRELLKLKAIEGRLTAPLGELPTRERLAKEMDIPVERVEELVELRKHFPVSLDMPLGDDADSMTLGDIVRPARTEEDPETFDIVLSGTVRDKIAEALATLDEREAEVMRFRFGFTDGQEHGLREVGKRFELTGEGVRQMEIRLLARLRAGFPELKSFLD